MRIWTSSRSGIVALSAGLLLASCELADGPTRPNLALISAQMGQGAVNVRPPDGYCLDKRSLRQDFALMSRCDTLGAVGGSQGAPLGLITMTLVPIETPADTDALIGAIVPEGGEIVASRTGPPASLVQVRGGQTASGTDSLHWRGLMQTDRHLISLAAYSADGGEMSQAGGADALLSLAQRTQDASRTQDVAGKTPKATNPTPIGLGKRIRSLFD